MTFRDDGEEVASSRAHRSPPGPAHPDDQVAADHRLHLVAAGAYTNWNDLYVDNVVRLYRLFYTKVGNRQDAEDLTAEVFIAVLGPLRLSASRPEVRAYLAATARSVLARYWSRRLTAAATVIEVATAAAFLADPPTESDAVARLTPLLASLSERHRRILQLRFIEGLSIKESAREMGISIANAKVLQHRALRSATAVRGGPR